MKALQLLVTDKGQKSEKKEAVYKFAAGHIAEHPVKQLQAEVSAALEEGNKLLAPSKQAKAKPKVELKNKKDSLSKALDKGLKKSTSKEKKEKKVKEEPKKCPKKAGRCSLMEGHTGPCKIEDGKRAELRAQAKAAAPRKDGCIN